jgi:hypothetical protein
MQNSEKMSYTPSASLNAQKPAKPDEGYLAVVMRIVRRTLELSNQPPLENDALERRARIWSEDLFEIVPEARLKDAYSAAIASHNSGFPVTAYEIAEAFKQIAVAERKAARQQWEAEQTQIEMLGKLANYRECEYCFNSGFFSTTQTEPDGRRYSGVVKCRNCDYWERRMQWSKK